MAPKKTKKSGASASKKIRISEVKQNLKAAPSSDRHFLAVLALFVGVSVYAISSFVSSNDNYIEKGYSNVLASGEEEVVVHEDPVILDRQNPFSDIDSSHWSFEAIITLYYEGIVSGYGDGTFRPGNNVNRAEFAKMLVEAADLDYAKLDSQVLSNCFKDVKDLPDHWFAPAVCAAKSKGWVGGYGDGGYSPTKNINRAEALKIILSAFGFVIPQNSEVAVSPYDDVNLDVWFLGVASSASDNEIVSPSGTFNASADVSRGEVSQMIYNAMKAKGFL